MSQKIYNSDPDTDFNDTPDRRNEDQYSDVYRFGFNWDETNEFYIKIQRSEKNAIMDVSEILNGKKHNFSTYIDIKDLSSQIIFPINNKECMGNTETLLNHAIFLDIRYEWPEMHTALSISGKCGDAFLAKMNSYMEGIREYEPFDFRKLIKPMTY